jgi:hypothetical protein
MHRNRKASEPVITEKMTLSELQAVAATRGVRSIRLRDDVLDPSRKVADVATETRTVTGRGKTVAQAIAHAFGMIDTTSE